MNHILKYFTVFMLGANIASAQTVFDDVQIDGTLNVDGITTLMGNTTLSDDLEVSGYSNLEGSACIGSSCAGADAIPLFTSLQLSGSELGMFFLDTDGEDWQIVANRDESSSIAIGNDLTTFPFEITEGAPTSSMHIGADGNVGLGTTLPTANLHISSTSGSAAIKLEDNNGITGDWILAGTDSGFAIQDSNVSIPMLIEDNAPSFSVYVKDNGNVGFGTFDPTGDLEISSPESFSFFRISATGAAVNDSVDITFTGGPLGTGQLRYNIVDGDNQEMSLDADGNMVIDGMLTTGGPTCAGGCDRVFDEDYALASIEERAGQMFADGHLPAVGPTQPGQPVNVTEKMGNMLNELEHAHIYIAQLHERLAMQEAFAAEQAALNAGLLARLEAIEAQ